MSGRSALFGLLGRSQHLLSTDLSRNPVVDFIVRHHTFFIAVALLFSIALWQCFIYPAFFSPLRHLPGPPWGHWLLGQFGEIIKAEAGVLQYEWAQKYAKGGPVIRAVGPFGIERVIFLTPKATQQILVDDWEDFPRPDFERHTLGEVTGHGLLTVEGDDHRKMRRMMTPAFSSAHLSQLVDLFWPSLEACQRVINGHIDKAEKNKGEEGAVFDCYEQMSRCTLDIICETAFGLKANSQETGHELADAYEQLINLQSGPNLVMLILKCEIPGFAAGSHLFRGILPSFLVGPLNTLEDSMRRINAVSKELIAEKTGSTTGDEAQQGKDVLSLLIAANKADDGSSYLNESQMMDQVLTFLGAGHETTASGMTWTLWLLANDQKRQERLRKECADLIARRVDPDMNMLNSLPYLEAVIKESMRVMPPVPMTFRKARVPKTVEGVYLPRNTLIYMGNRVMNTLPELWGEDSLEFKPERWLDIPDDAKEENRPGKSMYSYQTFISGPHMCIGAAMAKIEMKAMLTILMANYSFELAEKDQKVIPTAAITMKPKGGLPLRVKRAKTFATELS